MKIVAIFLIILNEIYSHVEWLVHDFIVDLLIIPFCVNILGMYDFFFTTVQLDSGIATGRKHCGYTKFEAIQYGTAKRFQPSQFLSANFTRNLNVESTCFPQSVRVLSMDRLPLLKSMLEGRRAKSEKGYLGSEEVGHQLNIWIPSSSSSSSSLRPVLVIFHGGAFIFSSCHQALVDGTSWAKNKGYVVVNVNYRLGIFGFLNHPEKDSKQLTPNCGTLDQLLALQWVQQNISRFGGDPSNVTVGAQSAGAISIGHLICIEGVANNLFHRAFMMSGANQNIQTTSQSKWVYEDVAKRMGFMSSSSSSSSSSSQHGQKQENNHNNNNNNNGNDSTSSIDHVAFANHLRSLPTVDLLNFQKLVESDITVAYRACTHSGCIMPFHPAIDGKLFKKNPLRQMEDLGVTIPVFIGTTDVEYSFFTGLSPSSNLAAKWHPINEELMLSRIRQWTSSCDETQINKENLSVNRSSSSQSSNNNHCKAILINDEMRTNLIEAYTSEPKESLRRMSHSHPMWNAINGDFVFRIPVENFASQIARNYQKLSGDQQQRPRSPSHDLKMMMMGKEIPSNLKTPKKNQNNKMSSTLPSSSSVSPRTCEAPCFVYNFAEPGFFEKLGAFHVIDLPYFFDKLRQTQILSGGWSFSRVALKNRVMNDVDNFIKGNYSQLWPSWNEVDRPVFYYKAGNSKNDKVPAEKDKKYFYSGLVYKPDQKEIQAWKQISEAIINSCH